MRDPQNPTPDQALAVVRAVFASRYEEARFGFAAGSIMRGEGTLLSDIDLVVVFDRVESARRESFVADGIPVEAFVHDAETLAWFVEADVARGRPSILNMIVEGVVIGSARGCAEALQEDLGARLRNGPPRMEPGQLNVLRYEITDAIDDLRGERSPAEIMAIGAMLHPKLVELALRGRQRWNGTGKWAPRLLAATDPGLADRFDRAFRELFASASCRSVIALAEQEMGRHGGFLFDGDCRHAPSSSRVQARS